MKRKLFATALMAAAALFLPFSVHAQYGQYGQYTSQGPTPSVLIDKTVGRVSATKGSTSLEFVDNLAPSDPRFNPEDVVTFHLKVKNTSDAKLDSVKVTDTFPEFVTFVEGPGNLSSDGRVLTFDAGHLNPQEEKGYTIRVKLASQSTLPADKSVMCLVNQSRVTTGDLADEDTAQFCVEKQISTSTTTITQVPATGPEAGPLLLGLYSVGLAAGLYIKKRA